MSLYPVDNDEDARTMAKMINGSNPDSYYIPAQQPSPEDLIVYENYEKAIDIVKNSENYDEDTVEEILGIIRDDYCDKYSSYDGNYKADISDNKFVQQFYQEYKRKIAYYKGCMTKIENKKYECKQEKQSDLQKIRKYKPNNLGKEMNLLIGKVKSILEQKQGWSSESDE